MFLVDPTVAAREWVKVPEEIDRVVKKHGATVIQVNKWGERKLSFPVRKSKRGTYVLAYFAAKNESIDKIKADFELSDIVFRNLIVHHEGEMRKDPPKDFEIAGTVPLKRFDAGPPGLSFGGGGGFGGGHGGDDRRPPGGGFR